MAELVRARRRSDEEGQRLLQIARRGKHGSVRVRRAMIIMASHPDLEGIHRPGTGRQAGPDRVRDQPLSGPLLAFDQLGPLSIRPCHGACWAPRKRSARLRATYHRTHGVRYFHSCYSVGDDQLWGITREHKGGDHTLAALRSIRAARPDGYRLFVIMDNLAANKTPAIRRWARRENVELCLTPTNASWANPIPVNRPSPRRHARAS